MAKLDSLKEYFNVLDSSVYSVINHIETLYGFNINDFSKDKPKLTLREKLFEKKYIDYIDIYSDKSSRYISIFEDFLKDLSPTAITEFSDTIKYIKDIGHLLVYMETTYFYQNDDDKSMWAVEDNDSSIVYFSFDDVTVSFRFQKSYINIPKEVNSVRTEDPLSDFKEKEDSSDHSSYCIFVEIDIVRAFGSNIHTHFRSVIDSNMYCNDAQETKELNIVMWKCKEIIIETLHNLEHHIIHNIYGLNLTVEDIYNGTTLWRLRAKE